MNDRIKRADRNASPVRVLMYWSYVPELWSKWIVRITGYQLSDDSDGWAHMGIAFVMSDGTTEAYESLFDKGFTGPEPLDSIREKISKKNGEIFVVETDIKEIYVESIYDLCKSWVGKRGYNKCQLLSMWFFERIGRRVGLRIPKSPRKPVCSEVVSRAVYPHIDLRDEIRTTFDEVNPNSAWRKWLKITRQKRDNKFRASIFKQFGLALAAFFFLLNAGLSDSIALFAENDCLEQTDGWYSFGTELKYKSTKLWGASAALEGYTPENKDSYAPQYGDRPYAGYTHIDLWKNYVDDQNDAYVMLSLGIIGPASGAEVMQSGFHYLTGMHMPMGWRYQLRNEPVANIGGYESVPVKVKEWLEFKPFIGANFGNRLVDAECGSFIRAGWNMPKEFSPVKYNFASYEDDEDGEFYVYTFAGVAGQAIAYDHMLDGSLFQNEIVTVRHKNFVANGFVGAVLGWYNIELRYTHCEMTEQWLSQPDRDNKWDGVEVGYKF